MKHKYANDFVACFFSLSVFCFYFDYYRWHLFRVLLVFEPKYCFVYHDAKYYFNCVLNNWDGITAIELKIFICCQFGLVSHSSFAALWSKFFTEMRQQQQQTPELELACKANPKSCIVQQFYCQTIFDKLWFLLVYTMP